MPVKQCSPFREQSQGIMLGLLLFFNLLSVLNTTTVDLFFSTNKFSSENVYSAELTKLVIIYLTCQIKKFVLPV